MRWSSASPAVKLPPWELVEIYENLLMKPEAIDRVTSKLGCGVFFIEGGGQVMRCRRPRVWWLKGLNLVTAGDMKRPPGSQPRWSLTQKGLLFQLSSSRGAASRRRRMRPTFLSAGPSQSKLPLVTPLGEARSANSWTLEGRQLEAASPSLCGRQHGERKLWSSPAAVERAAADVWVLFGPPELQAESVRGPAAAADRVLLAGGRRGEAASQLGPAPWRGEGP